MEHVDSDAAALGDDLSEEVHNVESSSVLISVSNTQIIWASRKISQNIVHDKYTRSGSRALFMQPTRRCEARGHSTSAEQLVCHYVPDGSAAGHTGVSAIGLGETRDAQANIRPSKYHSPTASIRRGILCACNTKPFVCFADVRRCKLHVAGDLQLDSSYRRATADTPAADRRSAMDGP